MMLYVLLGLCVAFLLVIAYLAYALVKSVQSERAAMAAEILAGREQLKAERNMDVASKQRDEAIVKEATAQAAADRANEQLAATQAALNVATTRLATRLQTDVIGMSDADALAAINAELGRE